MLPLQSLQESVHPLVPMHTTILNHPCVDQGLILEGMREEDVVQSHELGSKSVLGQHKGDSKWWYAWVPVVAPIAAAIAAVAVFKLLYL